MNIKVKLFNPNCKLEIIPQGDWIDLKAGNTVEMNGPKSLTLRKKVKGGVETSYRNVVFDTQLIPLGIAMELPEGYEAVVLPRSSTMKKYKIMMTNSEGVIDNSYNGNNDQWHFPAIAFEHTVIPEGERIAQFKIQLSQKATLWQKIKWLFASKIKFQYVPYLNNENRQGFGSTGS